MNAGLLIVALLFAAIRVARWAQDVLASRRLRGAFTETAPTRITEAPNDRVVQIVARIQIVGEPLAAPIHGRAAAFLRIHADGQPSVHAAAPATRLEQLDRWADVELEDESGTLRLDPTNARVELDPDRHHAREHITNFFGPTQPAITEHIASRRLDERRDPLGDPWRHLHLYEWILEPGARIAVLGTIEHTDGPYRGNAILRARRVRVVD